MKIKIEHCQTNTDILDAVKGGLEYYSHLLPENKNALILLKPNLNSHMNALAANTTDLRIVVAVVQELQRREYTNIVIGEGTNSGFYRNQISVIERLRIHKIGEVFHIRVVDLNYAEGVSIPFENGITAEVAKICKEAELFINLPKLKTHFEAGITVCLKNLIGCMVTQENKKKVHNDLPRNILNINKAIRPHLHIIDAIIAMEGTGPTRGKPVNYGKLIMGENPFALDYLCSRLMDFPLKKIDYLCYALEQNLLTAKDKNFIDQLDLSEHKRPFLPPQSNALVRTIFNHKWQKYFQAMRKTRFFTYLCNTELGGKILFHSGIRQDTFTPTELDIKQIIHDPDKCSECGKCQQYCPMGRNIPDRKMMDETPCLECLYCYLVCPNVAYSIDGELGFLNDQLEQFGDITREIT